MFADSRPVKLAMTAGLCCALGMSAVRADEPSAAQLRAADEALFDKLDGNEDGWLSGKEAAAVKAYDLDGNGRVTRAEFLSGRAKERSAAPAPTPPPFETRGTPPVPTPPVPVPAATADNGQLAAIGSLTTLHAGMVSKYLKLLTGGVEKSAFTPQEIEQMVQESMGPFSMLAGQLAKVRNGVSANDREFLDGILDVHQLLKGQARALLEYNAARDNQHLQACRTAQGAVESRFRKLFGAEESPVTDDPEKTVNAIGLEGNTLSAKAGKIFNVAFTEANLNAFPGNRAELGKSATEVAELLAAAANRYRAAASECEKTSQKSTEPSDAKYWSLKSRAFRRIAESKEGFRKVALLITDAAVSDRKEFDKRSETLMSEAIDFNTESEKYNEQAEQLWKKNHPKK